MALGPPYQAVPEAGTSVGLVKFDVLKFAKKFDILKFTKKFDVLKFTKKFDVLKKY